jgi:hypothetical protein
MEVANTPAYYHTATITAITGFTVQASGANYAINIFKDSFSILNP